MTFDTWKEKARVNEIRARGVRDMIADRAKAVFDRAFNTKSERWVCFHYAHNWQTLPNLTPEQRHACRYVLHLERKQWEPSRIVERVNRRMWEQIEY